MSAARKSAITPSSTPTTMDTPASNSGCGPATYDTLATSSVSRMPNSATPSSTNTASTVTLLRFSARPRAPPISFQAITNVHDSSASANSRSPTTSGENGWTSSGSISA